MPQFMVLLYDTAEALAQWEQMTEQELGECVGRYVAWGESLASRGRLVGSEKLRDGTGRVLRRRRGRISVTDGPYTEAREVVGGYFIVEAADYDEAVTLTGDCPHLEMGGMVEIREVEPVAIVQSR